MTKKIRIGVAGYGNLGRGVELAIAQNPDLELFGVFTRRDPASLSLQTPGAQAYKLADAAAYADQIDVMILCGGSATDLPEQTPALAKLFNVVDSFDTHAKIPEHFAAVDEAARKGNHLALISAGWDPGLFSLNRLYASAVLPEGRSYTFWGRGVSQGHSDAIRRISGVADAKQYTVPVEAAVEAVREGRGIFDNIRKFLRYLLSSNVGEVFTVFGGVMLAGFLGITQPGSQGVTVPLLATQLLWINLLTDAAPALAMGVDPSTDDVMARKPRKLTDRVIDGQMWGDIIFIGLIMAAVTLIGMDMHLAGGLFTDRSVDAVGHDAQMTEARTMGFTILVFAQMLNALCSRSHDQSVFVGLFANKWLWGAIALSALLQVVVIYVPFLNTAFGTMPLSAGAWVECLGLAMVVLVASELRKCVLRAMRE